MFLILSIFANKFTNLLFVNQVCEYLIYFYVGFLSAKISKKFKLNIFLVILFAIFSILLISGIIKQEILYRFINIVTAIIGTYSIYCIFTKIKSNKLIKLMDKNSFAIYLFHSPLLYIMYDKFANINPLLLVSINITIGICIPIIMAYILRKLKLNFIIGEKIK